ncbi:hypothetical protein BSZ40_02700 [Buchananella hordeovulneris]|uniref:HTH tetR-type domain-containing protein n=1 Tax=Buchananella hordeovulneris TaxID=52770 RepID=A0A1Q5PYK6_9ACTO|nr:hypothetical protein BSZ40_02700 [Buchananella hordeovulneris]
MFARDGYDATSVQQIARAAAVSHMTFFRHFPTKESVVTVDLLPFSIAFSLAKQDDSSSAWHRCLGAALESIGQTGVRSALNAVQFRQRLRLIGQVHALRGAAWAGLQEEENQITQVLVGQGVPGFEARAVAAGVLAACLGVLVNWAASDSQLVSAVGALHDGLGALQGT